MHFYFVVFPQHRWKFCFCFVTTKVRCSMIHRTVCIYPSRIGLDTSPISHLNIQDAVSPPEVPAASDLFIN